MAFLTTSLAVVLVSIPVQDDGGPEIPPVPKDLDEAAVVEQCVQLLLGMQESYGDEEAAPEDCREWPYEGVYRVPGASRRGTVIPPGYRVGGTAITAWALATSPGYTENDDAQQAVARGLDFVLEALAWEGMRPGFARSYDVRGWGHAYALWFMLQLRAHERVPEGRAGVVDETITMLVDTLEETEIAARGGWNYSRPDGFGGERNSASPFMTGPTLLALFEARRQGEDVDPEVVERALVALEKTRLQDGSAEPGNGGFSYGYREGDRRSGRPGAMGRITSAEVALFLAGRSDAERLRSGIDCFVRHWEQLEVRRQKDRTHVPPYGVAPYYVYFAHYHAALAISLLPEAERAEWRIKYLGRLFQTREESGGWNDRVFPRSENYGTSMALLSLLAREARPLARWESAGAESK